MTIKLNIDVNIKDVSFDQLIIYPSFIHINYVSVKENRKIYKEQKPTNSQ